MCNLDNLCRCFRRWWRIVRESDIYHTVIFPTLLVLLVWLFLCLILNEYPEVLSQQYLPTASYWFIRLINYTLEYSPSSSYSIIAMIIAIGIILVSFNSHRRRENSLENLHQNVSIQTVQNLPSKSTWEVQQNLQNISPLVPIVAKKSAQRGRRHIIPYDRQSAFRPDAAVSLPDPIKPLEREIKDSLPKQEKSSPISNESPDTQEEPLPSSYDEGFAIWLDPPQMSQVRSRMQTAEQKKPSPEKSLKFPVNNFGEGTSKCRHDDTSFQITSKRLQTGSISKHSSEKYECNEPDSEDTISIVSDKTHKSKDTSSSDDSPLPMETSKHKPSHDNTSMFSITNYGASTSRCTRDDYDYSSIQVPSKHWQSNFMYKHPPEPHESNEPNYPSERNADNIAFDRTPKSKDNSSGNVCRGKPGSKSYNKGSIKESVVSRSANEGSTKRSEVSPSWNECSIKRSKTHFLKSSRDKSGGSLVRSARFPQTSESGTVPQSKNETCVPSEHTERSQSYCDKAKGKKRKALNESCEMYEGSSHDSSEENFNNILRRQWLATTSRFYDFNASNHYKKTIKLIPKQQTNVAKPFKRKSLSSSQSSGETDNIWRPNKGRKTNKDKGIKQLRPTKRNWYEPPPPKKPKLENSESESE